MIIVDLDNCISDDKWRIPLINWNIENKFVRYHPYHMAIPGDPFVNAHIFDRVDPKHVIIMTSRPIMYKWLTTMWLDYHHINYAILLMREKDDGEIPSAEVKRKALHTILKILPHESITMAYDDRPDVIKMYKEEKIPATHLAINIYEWKEWYGRGGYTKPDGDHISGT